MVQFYPKLIRSKAWQIGVMIFSTARTKLSRFTVLLVVFFLAFGAAEAGAAQKKNKPHPRPRHHRVVTRHRGAVVSPGARYADIVIDARTGRIIHATNADSLRHPASLTKMMTLYITFEALDAGRLRLDQRLRVTPTAASQSPTKLGLRPGQGLLVSDAILGMVTESANDAAFVMAEALGGTAANFAEMMTRQAHALGMGSTQFHNPSGLPDPAQITTAHDMALLGAALILHHPREYAYFSREGFTFAGRYRRNHNHLMERYDGMDGIKTGYIRASGFNLVASAVQNNTRLIGVIFGGNSAAGRDGEMERLLNNAFDAAAQGGGNGTLALPEKRNVLFAPGGRTEVAAPRAPASSESATDDSWGVQIGAFGDPAQAKQSLTAWAQRLTILSKAEQVTSPANAADGSAVTRARFMGLDQKSARSVCSYIVKHGRGCLVVQPDAP